MSLLCRFTNKPWVSLPDTKRYLVCLNETSETVTQLQSLSTREWGQAASSPLSLYCLSTMHWADHNTMYRRRCPVIILNIAACFHSFLRNDPDELIFAKDISVLLFHSRHNQCISTVTLLENVICFSHLLLTGLLRCCSHAEWHTNSFTHSQSKSVSLQQLLGLHLISWGIDFLPGIGPCSSLVIMPTLPRTERRTANTAAGLEIVSVAHKQVQINISRSDENIVARHQSLSFFACSLCSSTWIGNV